MPLQGLVNWVIRGRLRTLLLCRPVSRRLITGNLVGRKTGGATPSRLPAPAATKHLLVGTQSAWAHNLHTGEPVHIRLADNGDPPTSKSWPTSPASSRASTR